MSDHETHIADTPAPKGPRRWLARSGVATGGLASLAVGAVLGGLLEGVPVLLPHHSHSTALKVHSLSGIQLPASVEDAAYTVPLPALFTPKRTEAAAGMAASTVTSGLAVLPSGAPPAPTGTGLPAPSSPAVPAVPGSSQTPSTPTTPPTTAPPAQTTQTPPGPNGSAPSSDPVQTLVNNTVTTVNQTVGAVSSTIDQTVGTVTTLLPSNPITTTTSSGTGTTTTSTSSGGTTLTSPVTTVTSTVGGVTSGL